MLPVRGTRKADIPVVEATGADVLASTRASGWAAPRLGAGLLLCADEGENNPGLKLIVSGSLYRRRLLEAEAAPEQ